VVGTLYVVGVPLGSPEDLTQRALRILGEVTLIVGANLQELRSLLVHYDIATPLVSAAGEAALAALETGDVAFLSLDGSMGAMNYGHRLVCAALERGFPVVSIPGPALPVTALVISGLPADSFVYLGQLPDERSVRRQLLTEVAAERRTLVAMEAQPRLPVVLSELHTTLGDRPLAVVAASGLGMEVIWRGSLGETPEQLPDPSTTGLAVLVIGGAPLTVSRWDEGHLRAEIQTCLAQGRGAREFSRQLAVESGWSRREVYRLAIQIIRSETDKRYFPRTDSG
jgi:16S rRNA (cytidine1402-2'-O)-methyltransferase